MNKQASDRLAGLPYLDFPDRFILTRRIRRDVAGIGNLATRLDVETGLWQDYLDLISLPGQLDQLAIAQECRN